MVARALICFVLGSLCYDAVASEIDDPVGPWPVGRTTFIVVDPARDDRSFLVDVWYPVDAADTIGVAAAEYDLIFASLTSPLALDAPPPSGQGARPLLVFSHGSRGIRYQSYFLTEALASHGFVVAAPDHAGNTAFDFVLDTLAPVEQVIVDRPLDVTLVIDTMLARGADPADEFGGLIDATRIGVLGHSFGGYTAFAAAGADTRVQAIVPIAPASGVLSDSDFAGLSLPVMLLSGTMDITTPVDPNTERPWQTLSSPWRLRADIIDGGHQSFTDICAITDALADAGIPPEFTAFVLGAADEACGPDLIDIGEAHRLTRLYTNAFMKFFVAGESRYRQVLNRRYSIAEGHAVDFRQFDGDPLRLSGP